MHDTTPFTLGSTSTRHLHFSIALCAPVHNGVDPHKGRTAYVLRNPTRLLSDMVVETSQAQAASGVKATYACQVCHRAYERLDHLNRHLDSREYYQNASPFVC